jgi:hypothetical protein
VWATRQTNVFQDNIWRGNEAASTSHQSFTIKETWWGEKCGRSAEYPAGRKPIRGTYVKPRYPLTQDAMYDPKSNYLTIFNGDPVTIDTLQHFYGIPAVSGFCTVIGAEDTIWSVRP